MADEFWGDPIYEYSTDQAIEDGVLVHPYPKRWPWLLITSNLEYECLEACGEYRTFQQVLIPLLIDCIMAAKKASASEDCEAPIVLDHTAVGTVWIMPNDKGGMTVMLPSDY